MTDLLVFLGGPLHCRTAYATHPADGRPYVLRGGGGGYVRLPDRPGRASVVYYQWVGAR